MALHILFLTIILLAPVISSEECAPIDYDISTLKSAPFWLVEADSSYCALQSLSSKSARDLQADIKNVSKSNCMIIFSVCKPLPVLCPNQGVCQIRGTDSSFKYISMPINLGTMDYTGFKFDTTDDKSFSIEYQHGDQFRCKTSKGKIEMQPVKTIMTFNCEKNAKWNATRKKEPPFAGGAQAQNGSISFSFEKCAYYISFNSSEGCPVYGQGGTEGHHISTGSILLILLFPSIFLYCVIGGMINVGRNKSGTQLIPNYNFWKELPYLILDGFGFVIAIITCSKVTTTSTNPSNSYQTM